MAISGFVNIPTASPLVDDNKEVTSPWHIFLSAIASGVESYALYANQNGSQPVNGFSIQIPQGANNLILVPAGVLATGTIIFPTSATDGQIISLITSQTITSLTLSASTNSGQSIINPISTLTSAGAEYIFVQSTSTWYRKQ